MIYCVNTSHNWVGSWSTIRCVTDRYKHWYKFLSHYLWVTEEMVNNFGINIHFVCSVPLGWFLKVRIKIKNRKIRKNKGSKGCYILYNFVKIDSNCSKKSQKQSRWGSLRRYCTPGPYFRRLREFSQKIKQLWTKHPMDLIRNVARN